MNHSSRDPALPPGDTPGGIGMQDLVDIFTHSPVVMYTMTLVGQRRTSAWVSPSVSAILGYTVEQALTDDWWSTNVHPDDRAGAMDAAARLDAGQVSHEYRFRHANGQYIWVLDQLKLVTRSDSDPRVVGSWTDISDARHYRQQLEEAEAHYRRLIRTSPYAVYTLDEAGRFRELNPAAERLLGRTDVLGEPFTRIMSPQDLAAGLQLFERVMAGTDESIETELNIRRPDGTDRLLAVSVAPIVTDGVTGVHGIARDITEERRIERDRERARQHYERLVKTSPDAIYALDTEGRFTEVSDATTRLLKRPAESLIGTSFTALVAPEDLPIAAASFNRKLMDEAETTEIDIRMIRGDGERRLVNIRATQIRDGDRIIGSHGIGRDVTDESTREEQLRRAERLASVGTLVAGVAHELNNPLTSIAGFAELMLMEPHSPDDTEMLRLTMREARRAAKIVADLRLIASDTQSARTAREPVDLNDVVTHALTLQRYLLETGNIEIVEQLADDLPPVRGTATELEQVVLNLIVNAHQALELHPHGVRRITISTRAIASGVSLTVADNGPGIPADVVGRIFDPFFTTKSPGEGMGLGLSLVHRIVSEHHGRVTVESRPRAGATFVVTLPCARPTDVAAEAGPPQQPMRLRVLVVDDEEPIRRALLRFLHRRGHAVDVANDGAEALQLIEGAGYDVILTDLRMPGMGGEMLLEALRARDPETARRVIFMTGDVLPGDESIDTRYGDVTVITKPFALGELGSRIEEHAARTGGRAADRP